MQVEIAGQLYRWEIALRTVLDAGPSQITAVDMGTGYAMAEFEGEGIWGQQRCVVLPRPIGDYVAVFSDRDAFCPIADEFKRVLRMMGELSDRRDHPEKYGKPAKGK